MPCQALLFSDEALMQLVGFNAQQVRDGVCQRGAPSGRPRASQGRFAQIPWPTILEVARAGPGGSSMGRFVPWPRPGPLGRR